MHPTANSVAFIRKTWMLDALSARRVMPGVRRLRLNMDEQTCQGVKRNFREALQALALPAPEQIRVTVPGCVTCELYEDFVGNYSPFLECFDATLSDIQKQQLRIASETLEAMSPESFSCSDETVLEHNSWTVMRQVAATVLRELGWKLETPEEYEETELGVWQRPRD